MGYLLINDKVGLVVSVNIGVSFMLQYTGKKQLYALVTERVGQYTRSTIGIHQILVVLDLGFELGWSGRPTEICLYLSLDDELRLLRF